MSKPTYTQHARRRMVERRVSEREVEETLANPYITYTDPGGSRSYVGLPGGRRVRVVVRGDGDQDPPVIITVIAN